MTMPFERTRALIFAYEYLTERKIAPGLTPEERREIDVVLRHYPTPREIKAEAKQQSNVKNTIFEPWLGTAPDAG
jgi:hypothetical protein